MLGSSRPRGVLYDYQHWVEFTRRASPATQNVADVVGVECKAS